MVWLKDVNYKGKEVLVFDGWNLPYARAKNPVNNPEHRLHPEYYEFLPKNRGIIQGESKDKTCFYVLKTYPKLTKVKEAFHKSFLKLVEEFSQKESNDDPE